MTQQTQVSSLVLETSLDAASRDASSPPSNFASSFRSEVSRVTDLLASANRDVDDEARSLLLRADALLVRFSSSRAEQEEEERAAAVVVADLRARGTNLARRSVELRAQTRADADELDRIAALADLLLGMHE